VKLSRLCAGDVVRFVQHQVPRLHLKRAKLLTTALRSFLHYVRYRGDIENDLAAAVPAVASWSMTSIPRAIPSDLVRRRFCCCWPGWDYGQAKWPESNWKISTGTADHCV
jgi:hypothetical protein